MAFRVLVSQSPAAEVGEGFLEATGLAPVFEAMAVGYRDYALGPLLSAPLTDVGAIRARQAAMQDLAREPLQAAARAFLLGQKEARDALALAERLYPRRQKAYYRLVAFRRRQRAVRAFSARLGELAPASGALAAARDALEAFLARPDVAAREREAEAIAKGLAEVRYRLLLEESRVSVYPAADLPDLAARVEKTFDRFRKPGVGGPEIRLPPRSPEMNHVEEGILEGVAKLYPELFDRLGRFAEEMGELKDATLWAIERGLAFFLAFCDLVAPLKAAGLPFARPELEAGTAGRARAAFPLDLALAREGRVVPNDFAFDGGRVLVVTGPNQGGKTTFARTVAQVHYLAGLGLPVPAAAARVPPIARFFSHFPRRERAEDLVSRLEDDLLRMKPLVEAAGPDALLVLNEPFASATAPDALALSLKVRERIRARGAFAVWVTFLPELARGEGVLSYVAQVDPEDPTRRTYKVVPAPPAERAYAEVLARRYRLSYDQLKARLEKWTSS